MAIYSVPYGKKQQSFELPDEWAVSRLAPKRIPAQPDPMKAVKQALEEPVGGIDWGRFSSIKSASLAINDKTRSVPHCYLLPPLLQHLEGLGIPAENITLLIASGAHPPMQPEEYDQVVPRDILSRYRIVSHDARKRKSLVRYGLTSRGTPGWINRSFFEADLRIVVGNIEPHQFMGYSGGVKSAVIGLGGEETIRRNHSLMMQPEAELGSYERNPARNDVEELGTLLRVDLALNAILNDQKEIVRVIAGEPKAVMREGIPTVQELYRVSVTAPFELIIASPGGHPKDINLYQAQKALAHSARIARKEAVVILVAACPEGSGSEEYESWVRQRRSHEEVLERFGEEGFRLGPHKAFLISRDASRIRVILVSGLNPDRVRQLLLEPVESIEEALGLMRIGALSGQEVGEVSPAGLRTAILPCANATIPDLAEEGN